MQNLNLYGENVVEVEKILVELVFKTFYLKKMYFYLQNNINKTIQELNLKLPLLYQQLIYIFYFLQQLIHISSPIL